MHTLTLGKRSQRAQALVHHETYSEWGVYGQVLYSSGEPAIV